MQLTDYIRKVFLRWRIIVAMMVLAVSSGAALSLTATPTYESSARVFISSASSASDLGAQMAANVYAQQKVLSYASVAASSSMAARVIDDLDLDADPAELASRVKTAVEYGTVLITITVRDSSAERAADITESIIDNYNDLLAKIDSAASGGAPIEISVMEHPSVPSSPASPQIALNIAASLVVGLLLGLALAALRDLLDDTVKSGTDALGGVPVVGSIAERPREKRFRRGTAVPYVTSSERSPMAEGLRQLRTNLRFSAIDESPRSILVTSASPGEGKSFISSSLASVFAATGQKVLLVDLDLRRPVQAERMGLEPGVGVTSVLLGMTSLGDAIQSVPDAGFDLLASGPLPPNPAEVLGTAAMHNLVRSLTDVYDIVILDTAPLAALDDARQIARLVDGSLVVVRHKHTRRQQIAASVKSLEDIEARVLGAVINFAPTKRDAGYYYY